MALTLITGTELLVGLGGNTYAGTIVEDATVENIGELDWYKGEENEMESVYKSGSGKRITVSALIKASGFTEPVIGDEVTINSVAGIVEKSSVKYERKVAKLDLTIVCYDSLA